MIVLNISNRKQYLHTLKKLFNKSEYFCIVSPKIEEDEFPIILSKLLPYCIEFKETSSWQGTKLYKNSKKKYVIYTFNICDSTFEILKVFSNFFEDKIDYYESFDEEYQLDISFFSHNKKCIFYTIVHEGVCMIDSELV